MSIPPSSGGITPSAQFPYSTINPCNRPRSSTSNSTESNSPGTSPTSSTPPFSDLAPLTQLQVVSPNQASFSWALRLKAAAQKIGLFLQNNWKYILLYILAWALILVCHHTVALTLTIWLGVGLGVGVIFGIFTATCIDKENKHKHVNSLWNLINYGILKLDPNGTRQILLATIIASISSLIYALPQAVGLVIGFSIGNQLSINTVYGMRLGDKAAYAIDRKAHERRMENIQNAINQTQILKHQMVIRMQLNAIREALQNTQENSITTVLDTIQLQMHQPFPYCFSTPDCNLNPSIQLDLNKKSPLEIIHVADQYIMTLSETLRQITLEPDSIIEE
ncbi:hypothetical protein C10C_0050 [Chlamydia serpentis]|uniref:Transmembrane protein n=1 Tax=Chlamydia serpentis TaxID=1967782 RepID=A0A2R8F9Y8_9CHLA|nr:hypothetical protein [Chlamydia serpentis]SPN73239.1 hypothetical protein C10C_0050 [Chlamydia serpentis]